MDAPQSSIQSRPVSEISVARLGTAIFAVLALLFSLGALIVAADNNRGGTKTQAGAVGSSAVLTSANIPSSATTVTLTEFAVNPKHVMVQKGASLKVVNNGAAQHTLMIEGTDLVTPTLDSKG